MGSEGVPCGMCFKPGAPDYQHYCAECMTLMKDPIDGRWMPKHWFDRLEQDVVVWEKRSLIPKFDFEAFLDGFKAAHQEWFKSSTVGIVERLPMVVDVRARAANDDVWDAREPIND